MAADRDAPDGGRLARPDGRPPPLLYTGQVVFDVPLDEVTDVIWPWYYFGGGVKLSAGGEQYRLSFVLPNGAQYPTARLAAEAGDPASLAVVWDKASDIGAGRTVGKEWRRRLERPRRPPPLAPSPHPSRAPPSPDLWPPP